MRRLNLFISVELQAIANITSWVEQGTAEIMTLIERFANKERIFLLGDFNVGSGVPSLGIIPVQPGNNTSQNRVSH